MPKLGGEGGKTVKVWLSAEARILLDEWMQEGGFADRGPAITALLKGRHTITAWQRAQAKRVISEMAALGLAVDYIKRLQEEEKAGVGAYASAGS